MISLLRILSINSICWSNCDFYNWKPDQEYFYSNSPVDAYTYVDMQVRYTGLENLQLYIGIDNLTDKQPSYAPNGANEPNPGSHYTGGQYRVWDSQYTYFGFNYKFNPND